MDNDPGICGRNTEIQQIYKFIASRIDTRKAGILYLTGPPGTGKTMSVEYVLDQIKRIPKVNLNCMKVQTPKSILIRICNALGLEKLIDRKLSESEMISRLTKKFTSRTCEAYLIVLDEMDQLPKSKNINLIRTIFSWTQQANSKLILVGIANTFNLMSRYQTIRSITGESYDHVKILTFKPYGQKDLKSIMKWYLENDENFEDADIDDRALDIISKKYSRMSGDLRGALDALRGSIDDTKKQKCKTPELHPYLTPPSTPPPSPCKEKTNMASVANSIRKREKDNHYANDLCPFPHQVILTCLMKLCSESKDRSVSARECQSLVHKVLGRYSTSSDRIFITRSDYLAMMDHLQLQGMIAFKKGRGNNCDKIALRAEENELDSLLPRKDIIMNLINVLV